MVLALPFLTSFVLIVCLVLAGIKAIDFLFPVQASRPKD